jgi:L-lysine 2,3-aminomutase
MDKELRKNYNKQYYENHKVVLLQKLTSKVNCQFCNRQVSFANLNKHITSNL